MNIYRNIVILLLASSIGFSEECNLHTKADENSIDLFSGNAISIDELYEWTDYLQSSDVGLWEENLGHAKLYRLTKQLTFDNCLFIPEFSPYTLCCNSDTIFITNAKTQEIVALDCNGDIFWKTGGLGGGPGEFTKITTLAVSDLYVAAIGYQSWQIELFNRDGSYSDSIRIIRPQDIVSVNDSTFILASVEEPGGDLHLANPSSGIFKSFGEFPTGTSGYLHDFVRLCYDGSSLIAVFNRYDGQLSIYDIFTEELVFSGSRNYPSIQVAPKAFNVAPGLVQISYFPIGGNVFLDNQGILNVVISGFLDDGSFFGSSDSVGFAPVTCVDRYDWDGNYLDSYCLPASHINFVAVLPDDRLVALDNSEKIIYIFEQL